MSAVFTDRDLPEHGRVSFTYADEDDPILWNVPSDRVSVEQLDGRHVIIVGDDHGMRVRSFPFVEAKPLLDGMWEFVGPDEDFTLTIEPEDET